MIPCCNIELDVLAVILDGAAIVHMLKPDMAKYFSEYAKSILTIR